jgi:phosphoribosylglycinamide formyltransferase 1
MSKKNVAVFISGHGSNLNVFLEHKDYFNKILTVSSDGKAYGVTRANNYQVPCLILENKIDWSALDSHLKANQIDFIFLAGFMKILPKEFISLWQDKIYNIHPSQLPKYKGLHAIKRAYEAQDEIGVTIHHVVSEVDSGKHHMQRLALTKVEVKNLTLEEVFHRTHLCEHEMVKEFILSLT